MRYVRAAALLAVLGSFIIAAGCGGGSGGAAPPLSGQDQPTMSGPMDPTTDTNPPIAPESTTSAATQDPATTQSTTLSTASSIVVPRHVMNAGFIYGYAGVPTSVPLYKMSPWMNWAFTDSTHAPLLRAAGIKVAIYVNYFRNHTNDNPSIGYTDLKPGGAHAPAETKTCSGSTIWDPTYGGGYASDARKTSEALGHAKVVVGYKKNQYGSNWDAMFADEVGSFLGMPTPCGYSASTYPAAINTVHSELGVRLWLNALGKKLDPYIGQVTNPSNVVGAMCELCYGINLKGADAVETTHDGIWQWLENTEISTIAKHKVFWDYARLSGYAQYETALRKYVYASFLLTYAPDYAMMETALKTNSGFPVMPETGLVPMNPVTTASSVNGYLRSGGAYMREFGACYYLGVNHGKCAIVINPNPTGTVSVPTRAYGHSLVLSGSGVLDGGSVRFSGGRVTSLAASTAAMLFP